MLLNGASFMKETEFFNLISFQEHDFVKTVVFKEKDGFGILMQMLILF